MSTRQKPAILGGSPAVTLDVKAANRWPILTEEDEAAVLEVIRDGDLSTHPVTQALEDDYRRYFQVKHALAHCNGTAALLAAYFALDLQPGDEVLVPSATFWSSVLPLLWVGGIPVFCESESHQLGLDPEDVERRITPRTRAMMMVHLWGMPSRMDALLDIARRHNLKVLEDASRAQGARWRGQWCGALGDMAVFSLQSRKLAPAGEGGMLLSNDDSLMERAICLGDIVRIFQLPGLARRFAATSFGVKTRIAPISAAIARVQLRHLDPRNARRNANLAYLSQRLEALGFDTFLPPADVERVYFEYHIRYQEERWELPKALLLKALQAEGCHLPPQRYSLLHQQPFFTEGHAARVARCGGPYERTMPVYRADDLPNTTAAQRQLIHLPVFPLAEQPLLDQYLQAFDKVLQHAREIAATGID